MRIEAVVCSQQVEDKLESKHGVSLNETRVVFLNSPRIRFVEKGYTKGEDVYAAFGQTFAGRYLAVFFIYKPVTKTALVVSAREMTKKERKSYGRK